LVMLISIPTYRVVGWWSYLIARHAPVHRIEHLLQSSMLMCVRVMNGDE
jgi:hypothetical protein